MTRLNQSSRTGVASKSPKPVPIVATPTKRKFESGGSYNEISSRRPVRGGRALTTKCTGSPKEEPRSKRARRASVVIEGRRTAISNKKTTGSSKRQHAKTSEISRRNFVNRSSRRKSTLKTPVTSAAPIEWSPSPTPNKIRRAEKNELRKRLEQVQKRLSFSGFDDDRIESNILTSSRRRRITSPNLTTPKKRKLESRGSYTEILPSSSHHARGSRALTRKRTASPKEKPKSKRARVIQDLMTRLDDVKASRPDTPPLSVPVRDKKPIKTRPRRPRRTCGEYQRKRSTGGTGVPKTVQQVARQLKRELAVSTPVISTMSLRNGKMKFSQS
ncbi:uncharacterized protein [Amphiura filiformis]|uniref:uncharacterized protein n=1 Tax=Amphiura filiformis TaxID=82378 RepID=UPI003B217EC3